MIGFTDIKTEAIDNVFSLIGREWMLITAGTIASYNTMTASWGGLGVLWNRNIAWCVVRPGRHTYGFLERAGSFTLSFFEEQYREALNVCGAKSGRDIDKAKVTGLTAVGTTAGVAFSQARLIIDCRKIYFQDIDPRNFIDASIDKNYPKKDYHRMYIGEIMSCGTR
ncbi:MAG: flavin reductase [Spirochaetota bacterium]